ncbi:MAG: hypothetical protein AAF253_04845 [Pseudomonadota bacterium]
MTWTVVFWALLIGMGFALFLAYQMRYFAGFVLRNAIAARDPSLARPDLYDAVAHAVAGRVPDTDTDAGDRAGPGLVAATEHLIATYPTPIGYIRLARTVCRVLPFMLAGLLVARWALNGGL